MQDAKADNHDYPTCEVPDCGRDLEFEDCWSCGGEGGEFLDELLPLEYEVGTWENCLECSGRGTISWCPTHGRIDNEWDRGKATA